MCKLLLIIKYHFDESKTQLWVYLISYYGCGYTRNELGPCALGSLDNLSCQLKLSKLIKDPPAQLQYLLFSCWYQETKTCSHHKARYLTNYEFSPKKLTNPFDKPNRNVTINILSRYCLLVSTVLFLWQWSLS